MSTDINIEGEEGILNPKLSASQEIDNLFDDAKPNFDEGLRDFPNLTVTTQGRDSGGMSSYPSFLDRRLPTSMDSCHSQELRSLCTSIEHFRRRLGDMLAEPHSPSLLAKVRDFVQQMDREIGPKTTNVLQMATTGALEASTSSSKGDRMLQGVGGAAYDLLRKSLHDTQSRCEQLSLDLERQNDVNEDLLHNLDGQKENNRRLSEEIKKYEGDISLMTQQRVIDEERMEKLKRDHADQLQTLKSEAKRLFMQERDNYDVQYTEMYTQLIKKLALVSAALDKMRSNVEELRKENIDYRQDIEGLTESQHSEIRAAERMIFDKVNVLVTQNQNEKNSLCQQLHQLEESLANEKASHTTQISNLQTQLADLKELSDGKEEKSRRDVQLLKDNLQTVEMGSANERSAFQVERDNLQKQIQALCRAKSSTESELSAIRQQYKSILDHYHEAENQLRSKDRDMHDKDLRIRESGDAVNSMLQELEALKNQLKSERQRYQQLNKHQLEVCKESFDERLGFLKNKHDEDIAQNESRRKQLEADLADRCEFAERCQHDVNSLEGEVQMLFREIGLRKAEKDNAEKLRLETEAEWSRQRQDWSRSKQQLLERCDDLVAQKNGVDNDLRVTVDELAEARRQSQAKELHFNQSLLDAQTVAKNHHRECQQLKAQLGTTTEALAGLQEAMQSAQSKWVEKEKTLLADVDAKFEVWSKERTALEDQRERERRRAFEADAQLEGSHQMHERQLAHIREDYSSKATLVAKERQRNEERIKKELLRMQTDFKASLKRNEELENDLARVKYHLQEKETSLQLSKLRDGHSKQTLKATSPSGVQRASSPYQSFELEALHDRNNAEKRQMIREISELRGSKSTAASNYEARRHKVVSEFQTQLDATENRFKSTIQRDKASLDSQGGRRLGRDTRLGLSPPTMSDSIYIPTSAPGTITEALDQNISRLKKKTDELNEEIGKRAEKTAQFS